MHGRISRDAVLLRTKNQRAGSLGTWNHSLRKSAPELALAAAHLAAAAWIAVNLGRDGSQFPLHGSCVLVFFVLAGWFAAVAYRSLSGGRIGNRPAPIFRRRYWQWCGACFVASYAATLPFGAQPWAGYVFWTSVAMCHAAVWSIFAYAPAGGTPRWSRLFDARPARAAARTLYLLLMLPLAGELGLRLYAAIAADPVAVQYVTSRLKLPAGGDRLGQAVNSQGYWDDEFAPRRMPSALRVAALGDEAVLCGDAQSNFLAQVEQMLPGVEVLNFGVPRASPREYAAQLPTEVAPCRPDLVLVFFSVGTDITQTPELPRAFDWRGLHLVQRSRALLNCVDCDGDAARAGALQKMPRAGAEKRRYAQAAARQLQVCRSPVPAALEARWQSVFEHLDCVFAECREAALEAMLVVVPGEFQVDDRLRETLCRRAGYTCTSSLDVELPQRRLAAYAKDRGLPMIDLLPHMRSSKAPPYESDADRLNGHGNSLTATILCNWLEAQFDSTLLAGGS